MLNRNLQYNHTNKKQILYSDKTGFCLKINISLSYFANTYLYRAYAKLKVKYNKSSTNSSPRLLSLHFTFCKNFINSLRLFLIYFSRAIHCLMFCKSTKHFQNIMTKAVIQIQNVT